MRVYEFKNTISTSIWGHRKLCDFYNQMSSVKNQKVSLNFYKLSWIDANMCALFHAMLKKLYQENNIDFTTDMVFIQERFNILFQNGFLPHPPIEVISNENVIRLRGFKPANDPEFKIYIKEDLMNLIREKEKNNMDSKQELKIRDSLFEAYTNIEVHASTTNEIYACGQYYPQKKILKFTLVDMGVGYLYPIHKYTNGAIKTSAEAIKWSLVEGHSSKKESGGNGLTDIYKHLKEKSGCFEIISGNAYWSFTKEKEKIYLTNNRFPGSVVNMIFHF